MGCSGLHGHVGTGDLGIWGLLGLGFPIACEIFVRAKQSWEKHGFRTTWGPVPACDAPCLLTLFNLNCISDFSLLPTI